jgi:hypothetical protein
MNRVDESACMPPMVIAGIVAFVIGIGLVLVGLSALDQGYLGDGAMNLGVGLLILGGDAYAFLRSPFVALGGSAGAVIFFVGYLMKLAGG